MTDEALALIGAAFIAGVKAQAVKEAKSIGVDLVKEGAAQIRDPSRGRKAVKKGAVRAVSPYHKHLGRVMKRLKKKHTKKNGDFKKGVLLLESLHHPAEVLMIGTNCSQGNKEGTEVNR